MQIMKKSSSFYSYMESVHFNCWGFLDFTFDETPVVLSWTNFGAEVLFGSAILLRLLTARKFKSLQVSYIPSLELLNDEVNLEFNERFNKN